MKQLIQSIVSESLQNAFGLEKEILVDIPKDGKADYSINTALQCAKEVGKKPQDIAAILQEEIEKNCGSSIFDSIEVVGPGFIYFNLTKDSLVNLMKEDNWGKGNDLEGQKIMIEFACPNTHKAFHIGHLRNICLGESIVRLQESQQAETFRSNYQGDIGPHVAKCLWALQSTFAEASVDLKEFLDNISRKTPQEKAEYLGEMYAQGGSSYEESDDTKSEVQVINKSLYEGTASEKLINIYNTSRQWSLDYFEFIYHRLGSPSFDHYFFESETWKPGKELVEQNIGKVFQESNGAIIFPGEDFGLHTRVFISSEGNPTYEAKEVGLAPMQYNAFNFDTCIHVVANEQAEYFKVVFEAIGQLHEGMKEKEKHLSYGMVKLTSGKMSSRTGDVITAEWLINEAKTAIFEKLSNRDLSKKEKETIAEQVAIGAIKFTMLHTMAKNDIAFDLEKAIRLDGDSGPYIQYAHARISSILKKVETSAKANFDEFNEDDWKLLKKIQYLPYHISRCAKEHTAHHLSHYLLQLTSDFSSWYAKNSVQNAETEELKAARIELLKFLQTTLKNGLYFMGIEAPEKM